MDFNVNDKVKVRLTAVGEKVLHEHRAALRADALRSFGAEVAEEAAKGVPRSNPDGWSEFQLWELMQIFGPHLYNGCDVPFETTIRIEAEPPAAAAVKSRVRKASRKGGRR